MGVGVGWSCGDFFVQIGFCVSFLFFWMLVNSFYRVVSCCLLPIPIYKAETLQMSAMRILHLFAIDEMVDKSLKQCHTLPQHHPNICVGRFADAILDPVRQSQAPVS